MPKARAYGIDATLRGVRETTYGVSPTTGYYGLPFRTSELSSEIPLGADPLLGFGRNAQDPYFDVETDEGATEIAISLQSIGYWMTGLLGDSAAPSPRAASGTITFSAQPAPGSTITPAGITWTFVSGTASGNQTQIGANLAATLTALAANLNASSVPALTAATYTASATTLTITHDATGVAGNAFTLAASATSNGKVSSSTLLGGGFLHVWTFGSDDVPSRTYEIGHGKLNNPVFFRHVGAMLDSFTWEMTTSGPANASVMIVAQGEEEFTSSIAPSPTTFANDARFSQGFGTVKRGGNLLANVVSSNCTFSNNLDRVRTIRPDGKIAGADLMEATATGNITLRFDGTTLLTEARRQEPIDIQKGFTSPLGWYLLFDFPRVFLPKPKYTIGGAGGVLAPFEWRAAYSPGDSTAMKVSLLNNFPSYVGL